MEKVLATVLPQARRYRGAFGASYPPKFLSPPNFVVPTKICFKHVIKTKFLIFPPQTLKPGYRPGSVKTVPAIRLFCFEGHSTSRSGIKSKTLFLINHHWGSLQAFTGARIGLLWHCT